MTEDERNSVEGALDSICGFAREMEGYAKSIRRWSCDEDPDIDDLHFYLEQIQDAVDGAWELLYEVENMKEDKQEIENE